MAWYAINSPIRALFANWSDCKKVIDCFPRSSYRKFKEKEEAETFAFNIKNEEQNLNPSLDGSQVFAFTDGSKMAGYSGFGVVLIHGSEQLNIYGGTRKETHNYAELEAIRVAIIHTEGALTIYSDSEYAIKSLTSFIGKWRKNGWKTVSGENISNKELIVIIDALINEREKQGFSIKFEHVPAHVGITYNEVADKLAKKGAKHSKTIVESGQRLLKNEFHYEKVVRRDK